MKTYGNGMKATEFSKKQINVLFAKAKKHELQIEVWFMQRMYVLADFYDYDNNGSIAEEEQGIKQILEAVFADDIEKAQMLINRETASTFGSFTEKYQRSFDRNFIA